MNGLIIKSTGSRYLVLLDDHRKVLCSIRGSLRLKGFEATNPVTVGDKVQVELQGGDGVITELYPRKNYMVRKSVKLSKQFQILAANIDRAFVMATPELPKTSLGFIDRFLSTAEAYSIPGGIIFNKCDLYEADTLHYVEALSELYTGIGYKVFIISAAFHSGFDKLLPELKGRVNLISGHSGVGKSTLINALIPRLDLKTAEISMQHLKGTHTTTFAEMHELPGGGFIIDTPGIREFGVIDFDRYEVSHFFPEIFKTARGCRFNNCLHINESECAVLHALEHGGIALSRYESYLSILNNEDIFK